MPKNTPCSIEGCTRGHVCGSPPVCSTHRERMRRTGTYEAPTVRPCVVDGCLLTSQRHDQLCQVHAHRLREFGTIDQPFPNGALNGNGYRIVSSSGHILGPSQGLHRLVMFDAIGYGPHRCHYCAKHINWRSGLEVDHVDHDRQNNAPDNLVPSCHPCNSARSPGGRFGVRKAKSAA